MSIIRNTIIITIKLLLIYIGTYYNIGNDECVFIILYIDVFIFGSMIYIYIRIFFIFCYIYIQIAQKKKNFFKHFRN